MLEPFNMLQPSEHHIQGVAQQMQGAREAHEDAYGFDHAYGGIC